MAKCKGLGTVVKADADGAAAYTTLDTVVVSTPPGREWEEIDGTLLASTLEQMGLGIEKATEFTLEEFWDIADHASDIINVLAATPVDGGAYFQIIYPTSTPITQAFRGNITKVTPAQVVLNEYVKRTITVRLTTASAFA